MVKSAKITADAAKGTKKLTDFFGSSLALSAGAPSSSSRMTRSRTATAPVVGSKKTPARSPRRPVKAASSFATLPPSSSPEDGAATLADSSAATLVPDIEMAPPPEPAQSPSAVRRSPRTPISPASRRVVPLTSRQASPTKSRTQAHALSSSTTKRLPKLGPKTPRAQPLRIAVSMEPDDPLVQTRSPRKKQKREFEDYATDVSDEVPPSRSEEQEMDLPPSLKARGKRRALSSSPLTSISGDSHMEYLGPAGDTQEVEGQLYSPGVSQTPPHTSPLDDYDEPVQATAPSSPLPPSSPVALDAMTKTEQMIAAIKARALATTLSSDEERPRGEAPRELSPDMSDEDLDYDFFAKPVKPKSPAHRKKTQSSPATATPASSRYGLRDRNKTATQPSASTSKPRPRVKTADPLASMLREKRAAERRGYDADAVMHSDLGGSSAVNSDGDADDEAMDAQHTFGTATPASDFPPSRLHTPELASEFDAGLQMLGEEDGRAVGMILEEDLASKRRTHDRVLLGAPFWEESHGFSPVDDAAPTEAIPHLVLELPQRSKAAIALAEAVNSGDDTKVLFFLGAGWLAHMPDTELALVLPWLAGIALAPASSPQLVSVALQALAHDCATRKFVSAPLFPVILDKLIDLRPIRSVLAAMDWTTPARMPTITLTSGVRDTCINRFVRLLTISAERSWVSIDDVTDLVVLMTMIAMDQHISEESFIGIQTLIDVLGTSIHSIDQEAVIARRLAAWVSQVDLANRVHFFTVLVGSVQSPVMRISRWIAHHLLVGDVEYSSLPSLGSLEALLKTSEGPFAIETDTEFETFYLNVQLMTTALSGLDEYVMAERGSTGSQITAIQMALDGLHGRIQDTRAADMDRSRTKAALLRLSMRLLHQRNAFRQSGEANGKPRKLTDYYSNGVFSKS